MAQIRSSVQPQSVSGAGKLFSPDNYRINSADLKRMQSKGFTLEINPGKTVINF